jgi:hypothetical protein
MKIFKDLSNGKEMVFYAKKLLNYGVSKETERSDPNIRNERQILRIQAADGQNVSTPTSTKSFRDSIYSPRSEDVSQQKICLSANSAPVHTARTAHC